MDHMVGVNAAYGCPKPMAMAAPVAVAPVVACAPRYTSAGAILVLFILLVIIARTIGY